MPVTCDNISRCAMELQTPASIHEIRGFRSRCLTSSVSSEQRLLLLFLPDILPDNFSPPPIPSSPKCGWDPQYSRANLLKYIAAIGHLELMSDFVIQRHSPGDVGQ